MIRVHIERLVLEGLSLDRIGRARLEQSLISELERLLESPGAASSIANHGHLASLEAPGIRLTHRESGQIVGTRVAESVFHSLAPTEASIKSHSADQSKAGRGQRP